MKNDNISFHMYGSLGGTLGEERMKTLIIEVIILFL